MVTGKGILPFPFVVEFNKRQRYKRHENKISMLVDQLYGKFNLVILRSLSTQES